MAHQIPLRVEGAKWQPEVLNHGALVGVGGAGFFAGGVGEVDVVKVFEMVLERGGDVDLLDVHVEDVGHDRQGPEKQYNESPEDRKVHKTRRATREDAALHKPELEQYYQTRMSTIRLNHPGGSYGYRVEVFGRVIVICTDVEYENDVIDEKVVEFARGADLLIHDAQYTNEELERYRGWGHATFDQAMEVAERAEVKLLAMTHHDPEHDDEFLASMEKKCQDRMKDCFLARQGMRVDF